MKNNIWDTAFGPHPRHGGFECALHAYTPYYAELTYLRMQLVHGTVLEHLTLRLVHEAHANRFRELCISIFVRLIPVF